jgi:hypothetical protein
MTFSLAALFAASLLIPIAASAQMDVAEPQVQEAAPAILALTTSSRAGISAERRANDRGRASADTSGKHVRAGTRVARAVAGGLVGILAGGVIGAAIGGYQDRHSQTQEAYGLTKSAVDGILGAAVGLVLGLIIGADWP